MLVSEHLPERLLLAGTTLVSTNQTGSARSGIMQTLCATLLPPEA